MTNIPIVNYRQRASLAVNVTFALLTITAITLRLISRRLVRRRLDASDYCALVAAITGTIMMLTSILAVVHGGLAYASAAEIVLEFGPQTLENLFKYMLPAQMLWVVTLSFSKISVLLLYLNLFTDRAVVIISKVTICLVAAWVLAAMLAGSLLCQPFSMNWTVVPGGHCGDRNLFFMVSGSFSLFTDLLVVLLPLRSIAKLQMKRYKKLVLMGAFSVGFLGCIFSALRLTFVAILEFNDVRNALYLVNTLSSLEGALASILCCIPMLRPLFGKESRTIGYSGYSSGSRGAHRLGPDGSRSWKRNTTLSGAESDRIQLRSIGDGKVHTEISSTPVVDRTMAAYGMANDDLVSVKSDDDTRGIIVKQEWRVTSHQESAGPQRGSEV